MLKFLIWAIALYALLEGAVISMAPRLVKKVCVSVLRTDDSILRRSGTAMIIVAIILGLIVNFLL